MMRFLYLSAVILCLCAVVCHCGTGDTPALKYLAEHLDNYCLLSRNHPDGECKNELGDLERLAPKQGKAGPRGPPGPPGDIEDLDKRIEQKLAEYGSLINQMRELEDFLQNSRKGHCQVIYNGKCFWFIEANVDYVDAHQLCAVHGAHPANIYSIIHYNMILKYVRGLRDGVTEPWLGMTYEVETNQIKLYNGSRIAIAYRIPWHPGYPRASPENLHLLMSIRHDWRDVRQGIWSSTSKNLEEGVVCEI